MPLFVRQMDAIVARAHAALNTTGTRRAVSINPKPGADAEKPV